MFIHGYFKSHQFLAEFDPKKIKSTYLYKIEKTLGYKPNKYLDSIVVRGCGMDMGFKVVDDLSHKLFGEGYKLKHHWL